MSNPSPSQVALLQGYTSYLSAAKTFDNGGNFYAVYYDKSLGAKQVTIMSMTSTGTLVWATNQPLTGTSGEDIDPAIVLDNAGGVYVAFTSLGTIYNPNTSEGKQDITIVKYNTGGVQQWIRQRSVDISMNTVQDDLNPSLAYDTVNGALYITYETTGATTPIGEKDVVMIKLTAAGTKVWERVIGTVAEDTSAQVTTDICGNIVIVYNTNGVTNSSESKTSMSGYDVAIAKYDTDGNLLWRRQNNTFNTTGNNLAPVATTDANGNIFCAFCVSGGTISGGSSTGGYDLVTFKLNAAGALQWARQVNMWNTVANDLEPSITVDSNGYLFLVYTSLDAVPGTTNSGGSDIIVLKIDDRSGGNLVWAKQNTLNNTTYNEFQPTVHVGESNRVFVGYLGDATDASGYTDFGILNIVDPVPSTTSILAPGPAGQPTGLAAGATELTWTGPSGTVDNYNLYNVVGDIYTLIATVPSTSTSVAYSSLTPSLVDQNWVVSAVNINGESMYSLPVSHQVTFDDVYDGSVSAATFITMSLAAGVSAADIKSALRTYSAKFTAAYNAAVGVNVNSLLDAGSTPTGKTSTELAAATLNILLVTNGSSVSLSSVTKDQILYLPTAAGDSFTVTADGTATTVALDNSGVLSVGGTIVSAGATFPLGNSGYTYVANGGIVLYSQGLRPGAPTNVSVTNITKSGLTLNWNSPVSTGDSSLSKYTITYDNESIDVSANITSKEITGLTVDTSYTFSITAVNTAGSSVTPASLSVSTFKELTSVSFVSHSGNSITYDLCGGAFSIPTTNNIVYDVSSSTQVSAAIHDINKLTITGLAEYTSYRFHIDLSGFDRFTTSEARTKDITAPGLVTDFVATAGNQTATLSWTPLTQDSGSAIAYYIYYDATSTTPSLNVALDVSSTTIVGLTNGTTYVYRIAAYDADGNIGTDSTDTVTPRTVPDAPSNVSAIYGNAEATVTWDAPNNNGSAITKYTITPSSGSPVDVSGYLTTKTITGLTNGTTYTFTVTATNAAGESVSSTSSSSIIPRTTPSAPTITSVVAGNNTLTVSWLPGSNGGAEISSWKVIEGINTYTVSSTGTMYTIDNLTNGATYSISVYAVNSEGNGAQAITTGKPAATATEFVSDMISNLDVSTISDFKANLAALAQQTVPTIISLPSTVTPSTLTTTIASGVSLTNKSLAVIVAAEGDTVSLDNAGLTQDTVLYIPTSVTLTVGPISYSIIVSESTLTVNGTSIALGGVFMIDHAYLFAAKGSASLLRVPDAPTNVSGIAGNQSVLLSWSAPSDIGGATSVTYMITAKDQNGNVISSVSGISVTSYTYTGLTNGVSYIFEVAAVNDNGAGPVGTSSVLTPVYVAPSSNPPGIPRNLTASNVTSSSMRISWSAPNTGGAVTNYVVNNVTTGVTASVTGILYYIATGLTADTVYTFSVYATNSDGNSASVSIIQRTAVDSGATVPCFFGNAPVLTANGYRRMDSLRAGDKVMTPGGTEATVERVKVTQCTAGPHTNPYVIPRGSFGAERRVLISPNHRVVTADGMVEARHLGLEQEAREGSLTYYNLELTGQANMVVGGVAVESLAPIKRMVLTMDQFKAVLQQKYGNINAGVLANIQRTCRFLADGRVEVPVLPKMASQNKQ